MDEKDNNVLAGNVAIKVREGRVLLTGTLPNNERKIRAIELAWKQKGVKEVNSELLIEGEGHGNNIGTAAADSWITTQVKAKLLATKKVKSINYSIETVDGVVFIFGIARTRSELDLVTDIASKISGVKRVSSYVNIASDNK